MSKVYSDPRYVRTTAVSRRLGRRTRYLYISSDVPRNIGAGKRKQRVWDAKVARKNYRRAVKIARSYTVTREDFADNLYEVRS